MAEVNSTSEIKPIKCKQIRAQFWPQVFRESEYRDCGDPQEVNVTSSVLVLNLKDIHRLVDDNDSTNDLVSARRLGHNGPHRTKVVHRVCEFFGVSALSEITQCMLEKARQMSDDDVLAGCIQTTSIYSSQDWAIDPAMAEMQFGEKFLAKAKAAAAFMQEQNIASVLLQDGFECALYRDASEMDEDEREGEKIVAGFTSTGEPTQYIEFDPEYHLADCYAEVRQGGDIRAVFTFKNTHDRLYCSFGTLEDLEHKVQ